MVVPVSVATVSPKDSELLGKLEEAGDCCSTKLAGSRAKSIVTEFGFSSLGKDCNAHNISYKVDNRYSRAGQLDPSCPQLVLLFISASVDSWVSSTLVPAFLYLPRSLRR
ncbi:hypothetical protein Tco_0215001 [Tanacetum coccineum]